MTSITCPLTLDVPVHPVIAPDGHTYDRAAIQEWVRLHGTSPMTREPMTLEDLIPNRAVAAHNDGTTVAPVAPRPVGDALDAVHKAVGDLTIATKDVTVRMDTAHHPDPKIPVDFVTVTVTPPDTFNRGGVDIACVIDLSYSMGDTAELSDSADNDEGTLTILQLVKHAVATVIEGCADIDRLSLVSFSTAAKIEFPLTRMDARGKARAQDVLKDLEKQGSTNIWGGLKCALDALRQAPDGPYAHNLQHVMLFTDGCPNVNPPRGHINTLKSYLKHAPGPPSRATIHTFGFGYSLDSQLLAQLALVGGGGYGFIPDASFVGTSFINALANIQTGIARECHVWVSPQPGYAITDVLGMGHVQGPVTAPAATMTTEDGTDMRRVAIGSLHLGQPRSVTFKVQPCGKGPRGDSVVAAYGAALTHGHDAMAVPTAPAADNDGKRVYADVVRLQGVDSIYGTLNKVTTKLGSKKLPKPKATAVGVFLADPTTQALVAASDAPQVHDFMTDLSGEMMLGLEAAAFTKWGRHYGLSLVRAHFLQQRSNFKDPGLQHYGGALFQRLQDQHEASFLKLPAPRPSVRTVAPSGAVSYTQSNTRSDMSRYYQSSGSCFAGDNLVLMHDGTTKRADCIVQGDVVRVDTQTTRTTTVVCVVESRQRTDAPTRMVKVGALVATPYHPIMHPPPITDAEGNLKAEPEWVFPIDVGQAIDVDLTSVFSFVVETDHTMVIEDTTTICLAHGKTHNAVVSHAFFGTDAILTALRTAPRDQYKTGHVVLPVDASVRHPTTGLVHGLRFD